MSIEREISSYLGNPLLKGVNVPYNYTKEELEEYLKCSEDTIYFAKKYIKIVNLDRGLVPFEMYDFQEEIIRKIENNRFTIGKLPRQVGKTTTVLAWLIHYLIFNENVSVAILANKEKTAKEILSKFKKSYENLPKFLQQGVLEWNKFNVKLENGSNVTTAATSSSAIRGNSQNVIILDEFAHIPENIAEEFFTSVYPVITSGTSTKVIIISTPKGMNMFYKIWMNAKQGKNSYVTFEADWDEVPGRDEKFKQETIKNTSQAQWDQEYECSFLGSQDTLIAPSKLANLVYFDPLRTDENIKGLQIYEDPIENHIYTMLVDCSRGEGQDYHAFTIINTTKMPYKVVAKFRNNSTSHLVLPNILVQIAGFYNRAYMLIEIKDLGQTVAEIVHDELEYENLIMVTARYKKGQRADGGFGSGGGAKQAYGVSTSGTTKQVGCSVLKDFIENDKLLVQDFDIISELSTFSSSGTNKGYEAAEGYNDDLVMTLVLFAWLSTQPYFKDYTNTDIRKKLHEEQLKKLEEDLMPFGFIDDGVDNPEGIDTTEIFYTDIEKKNSAKLRIPDNWLRDLENL